MIKTTFLLALCLIFMQPSQSQESMSSINRQHFTNINKLVSVEAFEKIKDFILAHGDRKTYRNYDSDNPHYRIDSFDLYLGADIGQQNINNDPQRSNFNQLTIMDRDAHPSHYELIIVRKGDLQKNKAWLRTGMQEENVYLVDTYDTGMKILKQALPAYIKGVKEVLDEY